MIEITDRNRTLTREQFKATLFPLLERKIDKNLPEEHFEIEFWRQFGQMVINHTGEWKERRNHGEPRRKRDRKDELMEIRK